MMVLNPERKWLTCMCLKDVNDRQVILERQIIAKRRTICIFILLVEKHFAFTSRKESEPKSEPESSQPLVGFWSTADKYTRAVFPASALSPTTHLSLLYPNLSTSLVTALFLPSSAQQ